MFTDDVHPLDFLTAFPSVRTLTDCTLKFIRETVGFNDDLLKSLHSRGIYCIDSVGYRGITEDGLIGFAFADAGDGGHNERVIRIRYSRTHPRLITAQFIKNLAEVSGCFIVFADPKLSVVKPDSNLSLL